MSMTATGEARALPAKGKKLGAKLVQRFEFQLNDWFFWRRLRFWLDKLFS